MNFMNHKQDFIKVSLCRFFVVATVLLLIQINLAGGADIPNSPAPYVEPNEPVTKTLTETEAAQLLESDWLFQAENKPTIKRVRDEIRWSRELALRLEQSSKGLNLGSERRQLNKLEAQGQLLKGDYDETVVRELYLAVRRLKRRIMFRNPVVDFTQVVFIDNPYPKGREWQHQARHRDGMMAVPGGRLLILDGLHPGGTIRKLGMTKPGSFWRPDLSFDAKKVLFCFKPYDEKSFHLYEVGIDGTNLRQLTFGDYDDLDPIYLPDGHIMFSSTRANTYIRCMPYTYCYVLARCDSDGSNIYLISRNNETDWVPSLLNDGRVIYSRWEYHDKALWRIQSLWAVNPDGTNTVAFWGNQSVWPDHLAEPRAIPGSSRIMFTGLAHHNWFDGSIGMLDQRKGLNFPHGLTKVTCDVPWPECGEPPQDPHESRNYHSSGKFTAYKSPYPLSEEDFLVSARRDNKFRLYMMDVYGNRELIYAGVHNIWYAMPVKPRKRPPVQADRVAWPGTGKDRKDPQLGVLYSADVYQGVPDLPRGKAKYLRVIQMDARTYSTWKRDGRFSGPVVSVVQDDGVKRILGTVPVEADGSVSFKVRPGVALHFQLLDEHYRALQTMRSFSGVMPSEKRGCVGCHEMHSVSPPNKTSIALRREPVDLTPPPWGAGESVGYERFVQPVLDEYCGKCHQGQGKGRKKLDLTLRPGFGVFKEPYITLVGYAQFSRGGATKDQCGIAGALMAENYQKSDPASYVTLRPMKHLSYTSKLIEIAMSGKHNDVKVDPLSLRRLIAWVDTNCPFRGEEEIRALPDPNFPGIEKLPIRPRVKTAPLIARP
ncbi:MAG: HzsA-related protein [Planctomycetota bacterium]